MTTKSLVATLVSGIFLFGTLSPQSASAGGSVVGNGAGVVENNFQYSYSMLPSLIANCLATPRCGVSPEETKLLEKIKVIAEKNASKIERLIFRDEGETGDFFATGLSEKHRIAKTGDTENDPIYVNTDLLYDDHGKPRLDYPSIISILIHEIGHQTGDLDHNRLDILGSKLRKLAFEKTSPHSMQIGRSQAIDVTIVNTDAPVRGSEFYFSWQNAGSIRATAALTKDLHCSNEPSTISGIEITNGSFFPTRVLNNAGLSEVGFSVWVKLFCYDSKDESVKIENFTVKVKLKKDLTLEILSSDKLR